MAVNCFSLITIHSPLRFNNLRSERSSDTGFFGEPSIRAPTSHAQFGETWSGERLPDAERLRGALPTPQAKHPIHLMGRRASSEFISATVRIRPLYTARYAIFPFSAVMPSKLASPIRKG